MTSSHRSTRDLLITSLLTALAILIPLIMPIKIIIGPASYTLGSHIPIVIAMFRTPKTAVLVGLGSAIGFFFAGFPIVIVLRALSHLFFLVAGSLYLKKHTKTLRTASSRFLFSFVLNLIHAFGEIIAVYLLTVTGNSASSPNFFFTLFILVGFGTLVHGMIDFEIGYSFTKLLQRRASIQLTEFDLG